VIFGHKHILSATRRALQPRIGGAARRV
jgi:hypothetical protein